MLARYDRGMKAFIKNLMPEDSADNKQEKISVIVSEATDGTEHRSEQQTEYTQEDFEQYLLSVTAEKKHD